MKRDGRGGIDRRGFLCGMAACGCAAALAQTGCTFSEVYNQTGAGELAFDINQGDFSALAEIGATLPIDIETDGDPAPVLLVRNAQDSVLALERICPHTFCDMRTPVGVWDQPAQQLICVCHNSVFASDGALQAGPSPRGIAAYDVEFDPATGQGLVRIGTAADVAALAAALTEQGR